MIIMPSRGRPNNLVKFINCYLDTRATTAVVVRLDNDDPMLSTYKAIMHPPQFKILIGKPKRCVAICNELVKAFPDAPNYMMLGDDCVPSPYGWDQALAERAGFNALSFGNGSYTRKGGAVPCHPCIGGDVVRTVGYMFHPVFVHDMADLIWTEWGRMFPDRYFHVPEVEITHEWADRQVHRPDLINWDRLMKSKQFHDDLRRTYDGTRY